MLYPGVHHNSFFGFNRFFIHYYNIEPCPKQVPNHIFSFPFSYSNFPSVNGLIGIWPFLTLSLLNISDACECLLIVSSYYHGITVNW